MGRGSGVLYDAMCSCKLGNLNTLYRMSYSQGHFNKFQGHFGHLPIQGDICYFVANTKG